MRQVKQFKVTVDREIRGTLYAKAGDIVYDCLSYNYGCASDDTRIFGIKHVSVTKNENGRHLFFTIPVSHLESIENA